MCIRVFHRSLSHRGPKQKGIAEDRANPANALEMAKKNQSELAAKAQNSRIFPIKHQGRIAWGKLADVSGLLHAPRLGNGLWRREDSRQILCYPETADRNR